MSENLKIWDALKTPPPEALSKIKGGRLNGMTDIKPQWRLQAMTKQFGAVGFGWVYRITKLWTENGSGDQICAFATVAVKYCVDGKWSEEFDGIGGSMLVAKENAGPHTSDECYKMAVTDALSVALKALGMAAEVYMGNVTHESKYSKPEQSQQQTKQSSHATADLARELKDELLAMSMGSVEEAADRLKEFTVFGDNDEKWMKYDQIDQCSEKWLKQTLKKVKKSAAN